MNISTLTTDGVSRIKLNGRFTFDKHKDFRLAIKDQLTGKSRNIEIDFGQVDYLDSSALGMLLLAREQASQAGKTVALTNCRGNVKAVLDVANFQRLFEIS